MPTMPSPQSVVDDDFVLIHSNKYFLEGSTGYIHDSTTYNMTNTYGSSCEKSTTKSMVHTEI